MMPGVTIRPRARRSLKWTAIAVIGVLVVVAVWALLGQLGGGHISSMLDSESGAWPYVTVFLLVFADAICPIFPCETTLNAASTLAAQGVLELGAVMAAGALGAVVGDSALYWIARRFGPRVEPRLRAAREHPKVSAALDFLGARAPVLLVAGRYVPGVRFVVGASLGLSRYPYRSFLLWSAVGGVTWSVYTCGLAYLVGTAFAGFPLASVVISSTITAVAIAAIFLVLHRSRRAAAA